MHPWRSLQGSHQSNPSYFSRGWPSAHGPRGLRMATKRTPMRSPGDHASGYCLPGLGLGEGDHGTRFVDACEPLAVELRQGAGPSCRVVRASGPSRLGVGFARALGSAPWNLPRAARFSTAAVVSAWSAAVGSVGLGGIGRFFSARSRVGQTGCAPSRLVAADQVRNHRSGLRTGLLPGRHPPGSGSPQRTPARRGLRLGRSSQKTSESSPG